MPRRAVIHVPPRISVRPGSSLTSRPAWTRIGHSTRNRIRSPDSRGSPSPPAPRNTAPGRPEPHRGRRPAQARRRSWSRRSSILQRAPGRDVLRCAGRGAAARPPPGRRPPVMPLFAASRAGWPWGSAGFRRVAGRRCGSLCRCGGGSSRTGCACQCGRWAVDHTLSWWMADVTRRSGVTLLAMPPVAREADGRDRPAG